VSTPRQTDRLYCRQPGKPHLHRYQGRWACVGVVHRFEPAKYRLGSTPLEAFYRFAVDTGAAGREP
jgi:hypothetical protein